MQEDFPPLRTLEGHPHNLPVQLTSFIGREKEMAKIGQLFQKCRFVTLTGPGGTGKTRLALQVAGELLERFRDSAWLVELAPLSDPDLVTQTTARALGMQLAAGPQTLSFLIDYLKPKHCLLIFDNCEHLIAACAGLVNALLHACPELSVLLSSREALGIEGEAPFLVPPMSLPDLRQLPAFEAVGQYEAIRLFVERGVTVSPSFTLTEQNASAVAQVCQRLDGIPLAIELAAARLKILSAEEIARRLDDRFRLLTGGSKAALPRYQTLRASLDWSYELLSEVEKALLQRLSVFAGGWTLEAAEAICCGDCIESPDVLDLLTQLVNKSLVRVEVGEGAETRYILLETIRQYAQEKLVEAGQAQEARCQHQKYYVELAERVGEKVRGLDQAALLTYLEAELDNIRLALAWSLESKNPTMGLRLVSALLFFWVFRGRCSESLQWFERLLAAVDETQGETPLKPFDNLLRARALCAAGDIAYQMGKNELSEILTGKSQKIYHQLGRQDDSGLAYVLLVLGFLAKDKGEEEKARHLFEEGQKIAQQIGNLYYQAEFKLAFGQMASGLQEYARARDFIQEGIALRKQIGDHNGYAWSLLELGWIENTQGNYQKACAFWNEGREIFNKIQNISGYGYSLRLLGDYDYKTGNYQLAREKFTEALSIARRQGDVVSLIYALWSLGFGVEMQGDYKPALDCFSEALRIARENELHGSVAWAKIQLGILFFLQGDFVVSEREFLEAKKMGEDLADGFIESHALHCLGRMAFYRGDLAASRNYLKQAARKRLYDSWVEENTTFMIEGIEVLAAYYQDWEQSATLLGATEIWYRQSFHVHLPIEHEYRAKDLAQGRQALGEEAFTRLWEEGKKMTLKQALEYGLAYLEGSSKTA